MKRTKILAEGAIIASLFMILLLITIAVPILNIISIWTLPLPFIIYVVRNGLKPGFMLLAVASALSFMIGGLPFIPLALFFGSAGLVIGELYRRQLSGFSVLLGGGLIYILNMLLSYILLVLFLNEHPLQLIEEVMTEQIQFAESMLANLGQDPSGTMDALYQMVDIISYMIPVMIVITGVLFAVVSTVLAGLLLRRLGHDVNKLPPFRDWSFPKSILWIYLLAMVMFLFGLEEGSTLFIIVWNVFPLLEVIMTIQGLAFIAFYCYHKQITKALPIIVTICGFIFYPLFTVIRILGIVDLGFDLRKRIINPK